MEGKRAACPFWQLSIGLGGYLSAALSRYSLKDVCVLKDVCAIQIEEIGLGGIFAIWHPLYSKGMYQASASPRLRQALSASSSGVS